tara:strand:- start:355 stop:603 length:249 start_codon:yes stop_codon:yes gene_type:complete
LDDTGKSVNAAGRDKDSLRSLKLWSSASSAAIVRKLRGNCYLWLQVMNLGETLHLFLASLIQENDVATEGDVKRYVGHANCC